MYYSTTALPFSSGDLMHRLNMKVDLQKFIWVPCHVMCTAVLIGWDPQLPHPPALGLVQYTRALLVSKDRRHLFVTPWLNDMKLHFLLACDSAYFSQTKFWRILPLRNVYELTNFQVLFFSFAIVGVAQSMFALYSGLALYAFSTAFVVPCLTTLVSQVGKLKTELAHFAVFFFFIYWQAPCPFFYYFFLYIVFVCKFRPQESQSDVLGDLRRMISLFVGTYFGMPPLLLPGLEPASPGTPTVLTRVRCLSLKPDMDREVRSHPPDSRISAKVQSWELGLSRVLRPDNHRNHPELRHVSSLHYRLRHQSCILQSRDTVPLI